MALPKIITPEYTIQLKSIKAPVRYRPYLVKEEKLFLTAKESNDPIEIERAVLQVIKNCTFGEVDVDSLPRLMLSICFYNCVPSRSTMSSTCATNAATCFVTSRNAPRKRTMVAAIMR